MQHQLSFKIDDDIKSTHFIVRDLSFFYSNVPANNITLEVYAPSSSSPVVFEDLTKCFVKVITVNDLHLNANGVYPLPALPDGAYYIRLSVAPNTKVFLEATYFRTVRLQNKYLIALSSLLENRTNISSVQYNEKVKTLLWYKELIDVAKYFAEDKLNNAAASEVYAEADTLLTSFNKCITC